MKKIFLVCSVLIILFSCKKKVEELPPATQTGAHTFGAKLDGNFWVPAGFGPFPAGNMLESRLMPNNDLYINARNFASSPNETEFELFLKGVTGPGTYLLNATTGYPTAAVSYGYYIKRNITPQNEWITSAQYAGSVTITKIDTVAWFVSGTFQFAAININNTPQPISVTEGRFDVRMQ